MPPQPILQHPHPSRKKNRAPPDPNFARNKKTGRVDQSQRSVRVTALFPVPQPVFPLELQTRRGGHPDRTRSKVGVTDLWHWSGRPWIHADFRSPPTPDFARNKKTGRVDRSQRSVRVTVKNPQQWGCGCEPSRGSPLSVVLPEQRRVPARSPSGGRDRDERIIPRGVHGSSRKRSAGRG